MAQLSIRLEEIIADLDNVRTDTDLMMRVCAKILGRKLSLEDAKKISEETIRRDRIAAGYKD
jgi:hypothetical protein